MTTISVHKTGSFPALTGSLFNDTDAENDPITAQLVTPPPGNTGLLAGWAIVYTPTVDFEGVITFTYAVTDTYNPVPVNAPATVELTIQPDICFVDIDQDDVTDFAGPTATTLQSAPLMQLRPALPYALLVSAEVAIQLPVKPKTVYINCR